MIIYLDQAISFQLLQGKIICSVHYIKYLSFCIFLILKIFKSSKLIFIFELFVLSLSKPPSDWILFIFHCIFIFFAEFIALQRWSSHFSFRTFQSRLVRAGDHPINKDFPYVEYSSQNDIYLLTFSSSFYLPWK